MPVLIVILLMHDLVCRALKRSRIYLGIRHLHIQHFQKSFEDDYENLKKMKSFDDLEHEVYEQAVFLTVDC